MGGEREARRRRGARRDWLAGLRRTHSAIKPTNDPRVIRAILDFSPFPRGEQVEQVRAYVAISGWNAAGGGGNGRALTHRRVGRRSRPNASVSGRCCGNFEHGGRARYRAAPCPSVSMACSACSPRRVEQSIVIAELKGTPAPLVHAYIALCAVEEGTYGMRGPIDEFWHTLVTFTKTYAGFCERVAGRVPACSASREVWRCGRRPAASVDYPLGAWRSLTRSLK